MYHNCSPDLEALHADDEMLAITWLDPTESILSVLAAAVMALPSLFESKDVETIGLGFV